MENESVNPPRTVLWDWDIFGRGQMVFHMNWDVPVWKRLVTRVLLGSRWRVRAPQLIETKETTNDNPVTD